MFTVSCALLVVFTCVIYRQSEILESRNTAVMRSYELLKKSRQLLVHALNVETSQRGYLLSGVDDYLEPYRASVNDLDRDVEDIAAILTPGSGQTEHLTKLRLQVDMLKNVIKTHLVRAQQKNVRKLTVKDLEESRGIMDGLRETLDALMEAESSMLTARQESLAAQQRNYQYTLFVGTGLGVGALVVANILIYTLLMRGRRTAEELRESEERFQLIMNGVNDGIYDLAPRQGTVYYSPSAKRMLGYTEEEYPNSIEAFKALLHPDDVKQTLDVYVKYAKRDIPAYVNEFRLRHKDGSWRWMLSRGVGQWDSWGYMYRLVGSHTDITQQREREEELRQLNSDMEGFTYIASHDLRAPLVNLRGFASEVRYALEDVEPLIRRCKESMGEEDRKKVEQAFEREVPEALGFIDAAVMRMDKLTSAILDMSRIGRREYRLDEVDANVVVERCLASLAHEIAAKDITVDCQKLPNVYTDPLALEQVFGNLLDNAVKYLAPSRKGEITVRAQAYLSDTIFSVTDNGRGIAETDQRKVFEIFRRAGNSGDVRGSGMGMAYVKATLRKLGGRIWFDSKINHGTSFYFTIPNKSI